MKRDDERTPSSAKMPAPRTFSTPELEAVIRRAVELQVGSATRGEDGLPEDEVVRIGQELGLEPAAVRRAMAEVRSRPPTERSALDSFVGSAIVRASRVLPRSASTMSSILDRHLREIEVMVAQRRFPDRIRYVQDSSFAAGLSRFARGLSRSHQPLKLKQLDVAVVPIDGDSCLVELSVDLGTTRGGLLAGVFGSSSILATGWAASVWATPVADPLMLVGVPVVAGAWIGMRAIFGTISRSTQDRLESLLDRLEHSELR